jgi:hypothetical protein
MGELTPATPSVGPPDDRLDSWKEIAAYLSRDVTTVQRWEKREAMPVHRHVHDRKGSVYAFRAELDAWARGRSLRGAQEPNQNRTTSILGGLTAKRFLSWVLPGLGIAALLFAVPGVRLSKFLASTATNRVPPGIESLFANAKFTRLTDLDGAQTNPTISSDGRFVAFISNRSGTFDVWLSDANGGGISNLTQGRGGDMRTSACDRILT